VYHPQSNKFTTVHPRGTGINKTINRAELAGTVAALINEHTHIAMAKSNAAFTQRGSSEAPNGGVLNVN